MTRSPVAGSERRPFVAERAGLLAPIDRRQRAHLRDEDAAWREVLRHRTQRRELIVGRVQDLQRTQRDVDEIEPLAEIQRPHVGVDDADARSRVVVEPRFEPREHRGRVVDSNDIVAGAREVQRDASGAGHEFQRREFAAASERLVQRQVVRPAVVLEIVERGGFGVGVLVEDAHDGVDWRERSNSARIRSSQVGVRQDVDRRHRERLRAVDHRLVA